jgi:hypothetical protein
MVVELTRTLLKVARNETSFGGNGSQEARNSHAGKDSASEPVPATVKANNHKELRPIMSASQRQSDHKVLLNLELCGWARGRNYLLVEQSLTASVNDQGR